MLDNTISFYRVKIVKLWEVNNMVQDSTAGKWQAQDYELRLI